MNIWIEIYFFNDVTMLHSGFRNMFDDNQNNFYHLNQLDEIF